MAKITITRERLDSIQGAMELLAKHARSVKLSYLLAKNLGKIRPEFEAIKKASSASKEFMEFEEKRKVAVASIAVKDEDGAPLISNNQYVVIDREALDRVMKPLRDKYAKAIAEREEQFSEIDKLMNEEIDIELHEISSEHIETEGAISSEAEGLALMLEPLLGYVIKD